MADTIEELVRYHSAHDAAKPMVIDLDRRLSSRELEITTHDLAATDTDGFVYYIGRRSSMIKTAGANVSPAEVEQAIAKVTGGGVAHVFGIPDPDRGQVVAAVVTLDNGAAFDEAGLRRQLAAELSAYKIPRRFAAIPATDVPLLASGKADVQQLKRLFDA